MSDSPLEGAALTDYRPLGYVSNPFAAVPTDGEQHWVVQAALAATNRLLVATGRAATAEHSRPIWIAMAPGIPVYYFRLAENGFLRQTALDTTLNVLSLNIPLEMMRLGRIRGTLAEVAELLAAVEFDKTLAAYVASILQDPDTALPEYALLGELDLTALTEYFTTAPTAAVAEHFGDLEAIRKPDAEAEVVLYETYMRSVSLDAEPSEDQDSAEDDGSTARPLEELEGVVVAAASEEAPQGQDRGMDEPAVAAPSPVREYVIAHMREHLSPVIARATNAYVSDGFTAVAQELKVTKAPKKTLSALIRFAANRFSKVVVVYDQFDPWVVMDDATKSAMVAALTELRWAFGPAGVMGLMVPDGLAPELEEQFASAERISWVFSEVAAFYEKTVPFDAAIVQEWLDGAALSGESPLRADGPELARIAEASAADVMRFVELGRYAFESAAVRGASSVEAEDVEAALAASESGVSAE